MSSASGTDARHDIGALETALRLVARMFAEELARAFREGGFAPPQEVRDPVVRAVPAVSDMPQAKQATESAVPKASSPTVPEPPKRRASFGLRPPDAIAEGEPFGLTLRFLEEQAAAVRNLFGDGTGAPAAPPPKAPTIADVFALGPRRRSASESELEVFP